MGEHGVGPAAAEVLGEAERTSRADDPAVQVEARGGPSAGAVGARRVDPPGQAGDAGVDDHPGPDRDGTPAPASTTRPAGLVPEDEGEGADGGQGGRRPGVVGEQVEVAAADAAGRDRDPGPRRPGSSGSGSSASEAGNSGSTMSNTTARTAVSVGAAGRRLPEGTWPKVPGDAGIRRHPRRGARAGLLAHGGLPRRRRALGRPGRALAPLPPARGLLRRPRPVRPLRGEPVRRGGGVPLPLVGPEPAGRPRRPRRRGRALPADDGAPSLQGGAVGEVRRRGRLRPAAAP